MSSGVKLDGFGEFKKKLNEIPKNVQVKSLGIVTKLTKQWQEQAIKSAPVDQKTIRGGITARVETTGNLITGEVTSNAYHSRFMEFGTKGKKFVPSDLVSYESSLEYKKAGNYAEFIRSIYDWVKRKGLGATYNVSTKRKNRQTADEYSKIAEAVAWSIMRKGVNPHPFFFIHKAGIESELKSRLKEVLG